MTKRLFIYTSSRPGSVSSTVLDKLAKEGDEKFRVWEWDLLKEHSKAIELKYTFGKMNSEQQALFDKIKKHKEHLDSFDEIYLGVAMHNFGPNLNTKTYIDVISQMGLAFSYENGKVKGLFPSNTKWTVVVAGGGMALESEHDHVIPWLKSVFSFVGVTKSEFIPVKGTLFPTFDLSKVPIPSN